MRDSLGSFSGIQYINDQSDWTRGRISDGRRAATGAIDTLHMRPQLFAFIRNLPTTDHPALITITAFNTTLGTAYNFGMKDTGMHGEIIAPVVITTAFMRLSGIEHHSLQEIEDKTEVSGFDPVIGSPISLKNLQIDFKWTIV